MQRALVIGISVVLFFVNFVYSWIKGENAGDDPWNLAMPETEVPSEKAVPAD